MVRWWHFALALTASVGLHGAADHVLRDHEPAITEQGATDTQISLLGSAEFSALLSGDETEHFEPVPVVQTAAVAAPRIAPVEPVQAAKPIVSAMAAAVTPADAASAMIAAAPVDMPGENIAIVPVVAAAETVPTDAEQKPTPESLNPSIAKPVAAQQVKTQQNAQSNAPDAAVAKPVEAQSTVKSVAVPTPKPPTPIKPQTLEKAEPVRTAVLVKPKLTDRKKSKKKKTVQKGDKGKNKRSSKKGHADGAASGNARSAGKSKKAGKTGASGNAAVSNYPGKVRRKLRRALRYPKKARSAKLRGTTHVRFSVGPSGNVGVAGVARSSGSAVLDAAALATVRRAAPFPKIPKSAGRKSWSFTVPLEFAPRSR